MNYAVLGWITVAIVAFQFIPYVYRRLNKNVKSLSSLNSLVKKINLIHRYMGLFLLTIPVVHAYWALGTIRLHTGSIVYMSILATASFGILFLKLKKKWLLKYHRLLAFWVLLTFILHLTYPNLI